MAAKLTRLTHKIAIQLHLVSDSCTICSSRSRRPVRKLLDTASYPPPPAASLYTPVSPSNLRLFITHKQNHRICSYQKRANKDTTKSVSATWTVVLSAEVGVL
jgi:hypothetical protein